MLEKLIVGRYIELDLPILNARPPAALAKPPYGSFIDSTSVPVMLQQSAKKKTTAGTKAPFSAFKMGEVSAKKEHRNFVWLKWVPPYVAQIPLGTVDVLTGPMSGCWVITYKWPTAADAVYIGHLGTEGNKVKDDALKAGWTQFAAANPTALLSGFQPNRTYVDELEVGKNDDEFTFMFGLVTPDQKFHSIKLGRVGRFGREFRIIAVREVTPTTGTALQTIFA
jgi:hypothetical protein